MKEISGIKEWAVDLRNADDVAYVVDMEIRVAYNVRFGRPEITTGMPTDPPEGDEVDYSDIEVWCHTKTGWGYVPVEQLPTFLKPAIEAALEKDARFIDALRDDALINA